MERKVYELLEKAQAGDEAAFNEIYQMYYNAAFIKANQLCKNEADAKDIVQEAFIQVHNSLPNLHDLNSFYSWLIMIVINRGRNSFRKHKILNSSLRETESMYTYPENRVYMNPHAYIENENEKVILRKLIEKLPKASAQVIKMMYFDQLKQIEIAEILKTPLSTIKSRCVKARKELKQEIEKYEVQEGYHLEFKLDMIIPGTVIGSAIFGSFKSFSSTIWSIVSQNATMLITAASISSLAIGVGTYYWNNYTDSSSELKNDSIMLRNPYQSVTYENTIIKDNEHAYFICLNFAQSEEEMKHRTMAEFSLLNPVIKEMERNNTVYYHALQELGWLEWYNSYNHFKYM